MIRNTGNEPSSWDDEADVVVVGSGGAALTAAIVAQLRGAESIVLEKTELVGGTTAVSGGGVWIPMNRHMGEVGVEDSREEALEYVRACAGGAGEDEIHVALVDEGHRMVDFLEDRGGIRFRAWPAQGGTIDYRSWLPGAKHGGRTLDPGKFHRADLGDDAPRLRTGASSAWLMDKIDYYAKRMHELPPAQGTPRRKATSTDQIGADLASGAALVGQLFRSCIDNEIPVLTETPVRELIIVDGRVVGVRAERAGSDFFVAARGGVVLATGGYTNNEELKSAWLTRPLEYTCDIDENQGDGHLMGAAVGAQLAGLGDAWWMPHIPLGDEAGPMNIGGTREDRQLPHTLIVNMSGQRFVDEATNYYDVMEAFGTKQDGPRNLPAWLIFDRQGAEKYMTLALRLPRDGQPPPEWMRIDDSLAGLAGQLGIDAGTLSATVERFNGFARDGTDLDFQRGETEWDRLWGDSNHGPNPSLGTVEKGPFHAIELRSGALSTKGGLRVNAKGEVRSALPPGDPIPGLYAAGNCSNGQVAQAYTGAGATIGAGMTFGYIIGSQFG